MSIRFLPRPDDKGDEMKKVWMTLLMAGSSLAACAQGTVLFDNIHVGAPNAPVYESDGVTKVSGPQYMAELLAGPSVTSLAAVATTSFMTGNGAGYFEAGTVAIASVPPGTTAWVAVEVWSTASGSSFDQAKASGLPDSWWESSVFSVQTEQSNGIPIPVPLTGLGTSQFTSTEQSSNLPHWRWLVWELLCCCSISANGERLEPNLPLDRPYDTSANLAAKFGRSSLLRRCYR